MLRLPPFRHHRPASAPEAARIAAGVGPDAMFVAGGTDLWPNMKRRHQVPTDVVALHSIPGLAGIAGDPREGVTIGAMTTLRSLERDPRLRAAYPAVAEAARLVSTPLLRNLGTLGGNLLLDTRCTYYDQSFEWRESISFCMKKDGAICWVAPGSPRCWAVQSSDCAPLLAAIGAEATLVSARGERRVSVDELYQDDGIRYLTKAPDEVLTQVHLPAVDGWRAAYHKLRRRGTFDFPVLGVGVWLRRERDGIADVRIRIGGAGSRPLAATEAEKILRGEAITDERIDAAAQAAAKVARPMANTDHEAAWRKKVTPVFVARALRECSG
jgi:4-hydroxybenzoyl-CoA reductase subunit beta